MTTTPLTKAIATLEGVVLAAAATVPWIVSLVNPPTLSHPTAAKWSVISGIALAASRTAIKGVALLKGATGVAPEPIDVEKLAQNVTAHIGVALPSTQALKDIVTEAVKVAQGSLPTVVAQIVPPTPAEPLVPAA